MEEFGLVWLSSVWLDEVDFLKCSRSASQLSFTNLLLSSLLSSIPLLFRFNVLGNLMGEEEDDQDQDSVKEAFLETNVYLLALTFVISIVHSVFEFLAFKNDIQFWNKK